MANRHLASHRRISAATRSATSADWATAGSNFLHRSRRVHAIQSSNSVMASSSKCLAPRFLASNMTSEHASSKPTISSARNKPRLRSISRSSGITWRRKSSANDTSQLLPTHHAKQEITLILHFCEMILHFCEQFTGVLFSYHQIGSEMSYFT